MDPTTEIQDDEDLQAGFDSASDDDMAPSSEEGAAVAGEPGGQSAPQAAASGSDQPNASDAANPTAQVSDADPYAGLPPQVRELLAVAARVPELEHKLDVVNDHNRRLEGAVRSFQSRLDKQAAAAAKTPQAVERITRAQDALRDDMPDLTDALEELKGLLPEPLEPDDAAPPAAPARAAQPQAPAQPQIDPVAQAHMDTLDAVAPGWDTTLSSADAQLWLTTRPDMAKVLKVARDAKSILTVHSEFTRFRAAQSNAQTQAATRQARMAAAATPQGVARKAPQARAGSEDEDMIAGFNS